MADRTPQLDPQDSSKAKITLEGVARKRKSTETLRKTWADDIRRYGGKEKLDSTSETYLNIKKNILLALCLLTWTCLLLLVYNNLQESEFWLSETYKSLQTLLE